MDTSTDLNDREGLHYQVGLAPPKPKSRINKIREAVLCDTTNDENSFMPSLPPLSEEGMQLREQYGEHKRLSKSRDRSANTRLSETQYYATQPSTNKYKRPTATFQQKYQKLEENFKKFTTSVNEKQSSKSPLRSQPTTPKPQQTISLLDFTTNSSTLKSGEAINIKQVQQLINTLISKLQSLSVSQDQELQIAQLYEDLSRNIKNDSHQAIFESLQKFESIFSQVMHRVFQIESATFLNYKFKDVLHLFEAIISEAYRQQTTNLMPLLLTSLNKVKAQAGFSLLNTYFKRYDSRKVFLGFKKWQGKPGRIQKLKKVCQQVYFGRKLRQQAQAFQKWSLLKNSNQVSDSLLDLLLLNSDIFDQCLESEGGLSICLQSIMKSHMSLDCDLVILNTSIISVYDHSTEEMHSVQRKAILNSITMSAGQEIKVVQKLLAQRQFDDQIDRPFLDNLEYFRHDLSVVLIPIFDSEEQSQIGILRFFKSGQTCLTSQLRQKLQTIATQVQVFLNRILELRAQKVKLSTEIDQQIRTLKTSELETKIRSSFYEILNSQSKVEFLQSLQQKTANLLEEVIGSNLTIRQIYFKKKDPLASLVRIVEQPILEEPQNPTLIRRRDHHAEKSDILVDWLDYQRNQLIQQVSISSPGLTMILHRLQPDETQKREKHLTNDQSFVMRTLIKCIEPVLVQGLKIHEGLAKQMADTETQLFNALELTNSKQLITQELSGINLMEEQDGLVKISEILSKVFSQFEVQEIALLVQESIFSGSPQQGKLCGWMSNTQVSLVSLPQHFIDATSEGEEDRYTVDPLSFKDLKQYSFQDGVLKFPVINNNEIQAIISIHLKQPNDHLKPFTSIIQSEIQDQLQIAQFQSTQQFEFKQNFNLMKDQAQGLSIDIDFMQAVQELLVLPFTQQPSLRTLGYALFDLTLKTIPMVTCQEVSLYVGKVMVNQDIRSTLFSNCGCGMPLLNEELVSNNFGDDSVIVLLPSTPLKDDRVIQLRLVPESDSQLLMAHIQLYQQIIAPFVAQALTSLTSSLLPVTQQHLPRVLSRVFKLRELSLIGQFMLSVKDLQVNRVPIFSRLQSYQRVLKVKPFVHEGYVEQSRKTFLEKQHVLKVYANAFQSLNRLASLTKQREFNNYKNKVLEMMKLEKDQLYSIAKYQPTKRQRKSFQIISQLSETLSKRANFTKLAVKCKIFRKLTNPHSKAFAAALCIQYNFTIVKLRNGFHKMRANAIDKCYRDFEGIGQKDKEFFNQLQRELLTQPQAQQLLEQQITNILERAMIYLQQSLLPDGLDAIVCSLRINQSNSRAYLFNKTLEMESVYRIEEILDHVTFSNMDMIGQQVLLSDFNINVKQDVIMQMLNKSGTQMFNFSNISNSLYQLYASQFGKAQDRDVVTRMVLLKKSRSALLCPLTCEDNQGVKLIGSLELYRFSNLQFDTHVEARLKVFTNQLQDLCNLFLKLRQTQTQISDLKNEIKHSSKPTQSLTQILKTIQQKATSQLQAPHFQCLILNNSGLAYFYQFKDNYIYNFSYEGTLIDEILQLQCVLELATRESDEDDIYQVHSEHRIRSVPGLLKTVTGVEGFSRIFYYPVICDGKIKAVFEVGYTLDQQPSNQSDEIINLQNYFAYQFTQQALRIKTLAQSLNNLLQKKQQQNKVSALLQIKNHQELLNKKEGYLLQSGLTQVQTEQCIQEYLKNMQDYDKELKQLSQSKEQLTEQVNSYRLDRQMKFKLISSCMVVVAKMRKHQLRQLLKVKFDQWNQQVKTVQIVESAFNKIMELNYKHAKVQFQTASYLLKKTLLVKVKRDAFQQILKTAKMDHYQLLQSARSPLYQQTLPLQLMFSDKTQQQILGGSHNFQSLIFSSGQVTPVLTNVNEQQSYLNKLHDQMGFAAVPKGISKREGNCFIQKKIKTKSASSKSRVI